MPTIIDSHPSRPNRLAVEYLLRARGATGCRSNDLRLTQAYTAQGARQRAESLLAESLALLKEANLGTELLTSLAERSVKRRH